MENAENPAPQEQKLTPVQAFVDNYWAIAKQVLVHPIQFYEQMPVSGGYIEPIKFAAISAAVYAIMGGVITLDFVRIPLHFCTVMGGGFLIALVMHGLSQALKGTGTYEGTYRVMAYSSSVHLVSWLPGIGAILGFYSVILYFFGLHKVQGMSGGKTALVVFLCGFLYGAIMMALAFTAIIGSLLSHR